MGTDYVAEYDGTYDRFICPFCQEVFEVESDGRGTEVMCDACGWEGMAGQ